MTKWLRIGSKAALRGYALFTVLQVLLSSIAFGQASVQVYVSYAENERPSIFFPNPWYGSPNTQFLGYPGTAWDTGGILIVNIGTTNVVLGQGVTVDGFQDGSVYKLWDSLIGTAGVTIHPGQQVILAQTGASRNTGTDELHTRHRGYNPFVL